MRSVYINNITAVRQPFFNMADFLKHVEIGLQRHFEAINRENVKYIKWPIMPSNANAAIPLRNENIFFAKLKLKLKLKKQADLNIPCHSSIMSISALNITCC